MARYIDADKLWNDRPQVTPEKSMDYKAGFSECMWAFSKLIREQIDNSTADVVPKSEVEELVQDGIRLGQENETLKDNNEHLAVILEETKAEVERLQSEKDALIKNYAECIKDYASEIFAEIETLLALNILVGDVFTGKYFDADLENDLAELKKKYTKQE